MENNINLKTLESALITLENLGQISDTHVANHKPTRHGIV